MAEQILPEMQDITRQREMAKMLLQQGMNTSDLGGQMVSGRYVGASPLQGIAKVYQAYTGRKMAEEADRKQQELADMLRKQTMQDIQAYGEAVTPRAGVEAQPEFIPQGQTMLDDQGMPTMGYKPPVEAIPEKKADYNKGLGILLGSRSPQSQALAQALLADQLKTQILPEGGTIVRGSIGGTGETVTSGPKKTTEQKEYEFAKSQGFQGSFMDYQTALKKAGANNLTVNTGQSYTSAFGKGIADQDLNKFNAADAAPKQILDANKTLELLDKGAITGLGANYKLNLARALNVVGANNDETIKNTEQLVANRGKAVLNNIRTSGLGAGQGFTDKDRQFLENVVGGTITLNDKTLRDLANLEIKAANASIDSWNSRVDKMPQEALAGTGISKVQAPKIERTKTMPPPPQIGQVVDGYRFKGGNPADPKNYEKVN
jgi:hypothetical protein